MKKMRAIAYILVYLFILSSKTKAVISDDKYLYWEAIYVDTRLLDNGSLKVTENQYFVFNGDWNGGYREVELYSGQKVKFLSLKRYYESLGMWKEITEGDIDQLDYYELEGSNKIKWRSRLESDPPFSKEKIWYKLEYIISGPILIKKEDGYYLKYDFLFPEREGIVQYFKGQMTSDSTWLYAGKAKESRNTLQLIDKNPVVVESHNVEPGDSRHVDLVFQYTGNGEPISRKAATRKEKDLLRSWFMIILIVFVAGFIISEFDRGRFRKIPRILKKPDDGYLREYILDFLPEEIGSLWDGRIGPPEVSSILARMVLEKKISTKIIKDRKFLLFPVRSLELELIQAREMFSGYERKLISGLFINGNRTNPGKVRQYYKGKNQNFSAVEKIKDSLENQIKKHKKLKDDDLKTFDWIIPSILFLGAVVITVLSFFISTGMLEIILGNLFIVGPVILVSWFLFNRNLRFQIGYPVVTIIKLISGLFFPVILFIILIESEDYELIPTIAGYLWSLAVFITIIMFSRTRNPPEKLEFRRNLVAIRSYWKKQLRSANPDLKDEYFPYLMAMGLSGKIDKWNEAYYGRSGSFSGSSGGGSTGWTGGGGSFGGAGAVGTWSAASSAFAGISVSASSSGSGGGGGGGGGGGW